ncbi:peptidoglycan-binding protein [Spirulina major CS-329]|uniref:peptidoglycan-binding protein n=1 Tax=Spirulina TaxID=1154 RepID=UPI002331260B|nr:MULTISPECIES: peptidoglycan-binding protein [Spirulina]MDB9497055.1 peptidoglycan-binding protein [Spirulina subsalsa CS-330]MDB9501657.1 peptidoglycan-binding protein [Spirulina major CS-329]
MESLSYLYYSLVFEADTDPLSFEISLPNFIRSAQLRLVSTTWMMVAIALFTLSLQNMAIALQVGDRGSEIKTLQATLKSKGYFNGPITGYYGPITAEAVQQFQRVNQLDIDGIAGPTTQNILYDNGAATNTINTPLNSASRGLLKYGQNNAHVRELQAELKQLGYFNGPISGYYGTLTEAAVRTFQATNGLQVDGVVGPNTRDRIQNGAQPQPSSGDNTANSPFQLDGFTVGGNGFTDLEPTTDSPPAPSDDAANPADAFPIQVDPAASPADPSLDSLPDSAASVTNDGDPPPAPIAAPFNRATQRFIAQIADEQPNIAFAVSFGNGSDRFVTGQSRAVETVFREDSFTRNAAPFASSAATEPSLELQKTIYGNIAPKSIVHSGRGLFFAQNMMYSHSITVYDRDFNLVKTIADSVDLQKFGYPQYAGIYRGSPVEASFSHSGKYAWVSNYQMYGAGFNHPGSDKCTPTQGTDDSFLYRINTETFAIDQVIRVGSVPKFVATTPDNRYVLVTNWCTDDLSIVDVQQGREIQRVELGRYPRGIVVDQQSRTAYVAIMGSQNIAQVDLDTFQVDWIENVGRSPRHLNLDPSGRYLYTSLNGESQVAKIDLETRRVVTKTATGNAPRSMILSDDGDFLYVVNYHSNTMAKVRTATMEVVKTVDVNDKPIGITYDPEKRQVWVSCYSGSIMVFSA